MGVITFNGKTSTSYGIQVEHPPAYNIAERSHEAVNVPGRNGDLFYDNNNSYKNVSRTYDISFYNESGTMEEIANNLHAFLHSANGYARLEDTYDTEVFRLAYYVKKLDIENILFKAGRGKLEFNCKPQRFLKSGETIRSIASKTGVVVTNPTINPSFPFIRIRGTGEVGIGNQLITVTSHPGVTYIYIDCEIMDAYGDDGSNCNPFVSFSVDQITLLPGDNGITLGDNITNLQITPRWWIL